MLPAHQHTVITAVSAPGTRAASTACCLPPQRGWHLKGSPNLATVRYPAQHTIEMLTDITCFPPAVLQAPTKGKETLIAPAGQQH